MKLARLIFIPIVLIVSMSLPAEGMEPGAKHLTPIVTGYSLQLTDSDSLLTTDSQRLSGSQLTPDSYRDHDSTILADSVKADSVIQINKKESPIKSKVTYSAHDSIRLNVAKGEIYLYGKAKALYEDISLDADYIRYNQKSYIMYANGLPDSSGKVVGKPVFKEKDDTYKCDEIAYNFNTKKGKIKTVTTAEGEGFLHGDEVKKNNLDEFFIRHGKYTTCNLDHPHFYIGVTKAKKAGKYIVSGPAYLVIEDVPLPIAVPFGFFPSRSGRTSGILLPEIGEDRSLGFFLRNGGYYFGINDYLDLTLRGDIYSKGSFRVSAVNNYYLRYRSKGGLSFDYNERKFGEPETPDFSRQKDFFVRWNHSQDGPALRGSRFSANVNEGTTSFLRNRTTQNENTFQNNLSSSIYYGKSWAGTPFSFSTSVDHRQDLRTGLVSLTLPDITFAVARVNPFDSRRRTGEQKWYQKIGFNYSMSARNQLEQQDTLVFQRQTLAKFRNGIQHSIPVTTSFNMLKYVNITPGFNYTERWYLSSVRKYYIDREGQKDTVITDTIRNFVAARDYSTFVSASTRLYGLANINKLGIVALRHVLNPSISYQFKPDFGESIYGYFRKVQTDSTGKKFENYSIFSNGIFGGPSPGKLSGIGFGLGNNLEMKVRSKRDTVTGTKKIKLLESFNISSFYNFAADSFNLSTINVSARTLLLEKLNIDFSASYDPYIMVADTTGGRVRVNRFEWDKNRRLAKLTNASLTFSTNLNSQAFNKKQSAHTKKFSPEEIDYINNNYQTFVDFNIPWSLSIFYNINYVNPGGAKTIKQSLNFNGDVNITAKWKIGFNSGYDFILNKPSFTSLNIYRDLHCWDLAIRWVPFGTYQSYSVDLKVKAAILQDLKLSRRREYYER